MCIDGIDSADYSRDSFLDPSDTADRVVVNLGLNGANGTGAEFDAVTNLSNLTISYVQVSVDVLISIDNVIGTVEPDVFVGNELDNTLDGRSGNDVLDGGFGNDTLIGSVGNDTASFISHDLGAMLLGERDTIS